MHPFCQVVVVLPIPVPFEPLIERFARHAFVQFFPNPEAPNGRMQFALLLMQAADPAFPRVVFTVPAEDMVHLVDKAQCKVPVCCIICPVIQFKVVAYRKRIRPQVSSRRRRRRIKPCHAGKLLHDPVDKGNRIVFGHSIALLYNEQKFFSSPLMSFFRVP